MQPIKTAVITMLMALALAIVLTSETLRLAEGVAPLFLVAGGVAD
jgi:hypothetical protein